MPFIPHTDDDVREMLAECGVERINELFDEIPDSLISKSLSAIPRGLSEMEVSRLMHDASRREGVFLNFIGAGAYEHHIPAAVWQVATRGEFYSAYTPYQAEASQGTLQVLYEYQSMMCSLTGMDVANASLYDGASALAEAVLMSVRLHKSARRVLLPTALHPAYRATVRTIVSNQGIEIVEVPYCRDSGRTLLDSVKTELSTGAAALVIAQPNFFGVLEDVDALTELAHGAGVTVIGCVNPVTLALLKPPGQWGEQGADIAVGDGQPLGIPLSSGGPYFGFLACRQNLVRQMPGRVVGRTVDLEGKPGFTLTLQAREQHIRRSKATSNICTNQGLAVTAAAIHLSLLGAEGLRRVAAQSHANMKRLLGIISGIEGASQRFDSAYFHEAVVVLSVPAQTVCRSLLEEGVIAGYQLGAQYPELGEALLICTTETRTETDLQLYAAAMARCLEGAPQKTKVT
ncbi:MAG: aminomethyl-transferring glycine dehydrogenase subunit GcvPA [Betaproteobacteria bacterium]|nr:MAG: aminomethyl-transferring glycine dehydrogenase subunit GcvPA [Betaproteobacteria bacterium]